MFQILFKNRGHGRKVICNATKTSKSGFGIENSMCNKNMNASLTSALLASGSLGPVPAFGTVW